MRIDKLTSKELRQYYINNRNYYNQLASYYSIHDPEYYESEFLTLERKINLRRYYWGRRIKFSFYFIVILLFILYYILPFEFRIGFTDYQIKKNSFSISSFELPDFMKGMDMFSKEQYMEAKHFFEKVDPYDPNGISATTKQLGAPRRTAAVISIIKSSVTGSVVSYPRITFAAESPTSSMGTPASCMRRAVVKS